MPGRFGEDRDKGHPSTAWMVKLPHPVEAFSPYRISSEPSHYSITQGRRSSELRHGFFGARKQEPGGRLFGAARRRVQMLESISPGKMRDLFSLFNQAGKSKYRWHL